MNYTDERDAYNIKGVHKSLKKLSFGNLRTKMRAPLSQHPEQLSLLKQVG